jgi:ABC-2 type transport system ATP-binding protein
MEVHLARPLHRPWPRLDEHLQVEAVGDSFLRYRTARPEIANPILLRKLHEENAAVLTVAQAPQSLEQVYLKLVEGEA